MPSNKFLGIDYGTKRIGLAVSDERCTLAFPKTIVENNAGALARIRKIIHEENVGGIVIGESLDFKGKPNAIAQDIESFMGELGELGLPIFKEKEFLTSVEARRLQSSLGKVDASAAAIILQRYLDRKNLV